MLVIIFALRNLFVSIMTVMYSVVNHTESCESMVRGALRRSLPARLTAGVPADNGGRG